MALLHPDRVDQQTRNEIKKLSVGYLDPLQYYVDKLAYGLGRIGAAFYPNDVIIRLPILKAMNINIFSEGNFSNQMKKIP